MTEERRRRRRRRMASARELAPRAALWTLLLAGPLLIAGRPGWAITVLALVAALALGLSVRMGGRVATDRASLAVFGALGLGTLVTIAQAVPLPLGLTRMLVPASVLDVEATARLARVPVPDAWPLSVSPTATSAAILAGLALLCTALAASALGTAGRTRDVARAVGVAGIAVALVTIAHEALGLDRVYGFYALPWRPGMLSPLVNENHLAGFLAMTVPVQLGLALEAESQPGRVGWVVGAALTAVVTVAAISRGGFVGLVVGLVVLAVLVLRARGREGQLRFGRAQLIAALVGATLAVAVTAYAIQEAWLRDWENTTLAKVRLALEGLDLLVDRTVLGIGRGAYSEAFVRLHGVGDRVEYAESLPIQWLVDWGVVVGSAILLALGLAWASAARAATSPVRIGAVAAIASITVHDLVDFALEELGLAIVAIALFAAVLARPEKTPLETRTRRWLDRGRWSLVAMGAAGALLLGPRIDGERVRPTADRLSRLATAGDRATFAEELVPAIVAHPSEPAIPMLAGYEAALHDDGSAIRWLNRAMALAPEWPAPHLLAARALARRGAIAQAWLEVREVERLRSMGGLGEACVLLRGAPSARHPLETFEHEPGGLALLDRLVETCAGADASVVADIDRRLEDSGLAGPVLRAARRAVAAGDHEAALRRLESLSTDDVPTVVCRARALSGLDRHAEAIEALRAAHPTDDRERLQVLEAVARAQAAIGDAEGMRATMAVIRGAAGPSPTRAAEALVLLGDLERTLGNSGRAMRAFEEAERMSSASVGLSRVAAVAEELGDLRRAYQAQVELCRRRSAAECPAAERLGGRRERTERP